MQYIYCTMFDTGGTVIKYYYNNDFDRFNYDYEIHNNCNCFCVDDK